MNVLVDDSDPLVQYSNHSKGWVQPHPSKVQPNQFNRTVREPLALGETATLAFEGRPCLCYCAVLCQNEGIQERLSLSLEPLRAMDQPDGISLSTAGRWAHLTSTSNLRWAITLFSGNLRRSRMQCTPLQSSWTMTRNFVRTGPFSSTAYFVYNTTSTAGKSVLIDDSETGVITYSPDWQAYNDSDGGLQRTQHVSGVGGSSVALCFEGARSCLILSKLI